MADEREELSLSFGIENTMDMGVGDQTLLTDLFSPETQTAKPEDIQEIVKETPPPITPKTKEKDAKPSEEEQVPDGQSIVSSFLEGTEEESDEEEQVAPPVTKPSAEEEEEVAPNQFNALAKDLFKLGVFVKGEDEEEVAINTPEEFLERFTQEKKKGAIEIVENFIGQFGEDYQNAFDAIFVKGVNPKEYFGIYNTIVDFAELDLKQEDNQVRVIRQALTDQGLEPEDVETEIERLRNYGDLEVVATKHHKVLVKKQAAALKQKQETAERELQQKAAIREQYIDNVQKVLQEKLKTKEFDGIPINAKLASELQDFLLVDKYKTVSGETLTDFDKTILELKRPENHAMKVKIALLIKVLEKDPTLSTIQRSAISKKSDQLFSEVARQVTKDKTGTKAPQQNKNIWSF